MGLAATDLSRKQADLAAAVVNGALTVTEAGQKAKYGHRESASRALRTAPVQREIERLKAVQRDRARPALRAAVAKIASGVDRDQDGEYSLKASIALSNVIEKVGDEEREEPLEPQVTHAGAQLAAAFLAGLTYTTRSGMTQERLDVIVARLTERAVSWYQARGYTERPKTT